MAYGASAPPKPGKPAAAGRPGFNNGGYAGLPSPKGPKPVNLAGAYKNLTSQPNYAQTHSPSGAYVGAPGARPVNMAQGYGNQGGQLPGYSYAGGPAGTWTPTTAPPAQQGGSSGAAAQPDWLTAAQSDPQYLAQVADNNFKVGNQVDTLNQTLGFDTTNLQQALGGLAYQQPRDQLALEQKANTRGALFSSVYGQQAGNLAHTYDTKQTGLNENFAKTKAGIEEKISGLQNSVPLFNANALANAIARAQKNLPITPATPPGAGGGAGAGGTTPAPGGGSTTAGGSAIPANPQPMFNNGGYAGLRGANGKPIPVNLAQAYANMKGGNVVTPVMNQGGYAGLKGPGQKAPTSVDLAQAFRNMGGKLKKGKGK